LSRKSNENGQSENAPKIVDALYFNQEVFKLANQEQVIVALAVSRLTDDKLSAYRRLCGKAGIHLILFGAPLIAVDNPFGAIAIELPVYVDTKIILSLVTETRIDERLKPRIATELERKSLFVASHETNTPAVICSDPISGCSLL